MILFTVIIHTGTSCQAGTNDAVSGRCSYGAYAMVMAVDSTFTLSYALAALNNRPLTRATYNGRPNKLRLQFSTFGISRISLIHITVGSCRIRRSHLLRICRKSIKIGCNKDIGVSRKSIQYDLLLNSTIYPRPRDLGCSGSIGN